MSDDRTARSSDHAGDTLAPVTSVPQREPRGWRQAVRRSLYTSTARSSSAPATPAATALSRGRLRSPHGRTPPPSSRFRETATDTGVVTAAAADDRAPDVSEPPAAPPSPPAVFDAFRVRRPSARGAYELRDGIGVPIQAGADVLALRSKHRRVNVNEPSDIDRAEAILETTPE